VNGRAAVFIIPMDHPYFRLSLAFGQRRSGKFEDGLRWYFDLPAIVVTRHVASGGLSKAIFTTQVLVAAALQRRIA
jgi:hypothetical protein